MKLDTPKLVALDTSQLSGLVRDAFSSDRQGRQRASAFDRRLADAGAIVLVFGHHISELLQHQNDLTVARRLDYLRSRPLMAWVKRSDGGPGAGTIACMLAGEIATVAQEEGASARAVRDATKPKLIGYGTGEHAIAAHDPIWRELRQLLLSDRHRARAAVAVTRANIPDTGNIRLSDLASVPLRSADERMRYFSYLRSFLRNDIVENADKRIEDPEGIAKWFVSLVEAESRAVRFDSKNPLMDHLESLGITADDLGANAKLGDARRLLEFRGKARVAAEAAKIALPHYRVADMDRFPAWIIDNGLIRFGQKRATSTGGDQNDRYLACLAAYADLTFVDKRTHADAMQACRTSPLFKSLVGRIERVRDYDQITID